MDFLQSEHWRKFQESVGRKTFLIDSENFHVSIIQHELPIVGKYFYIPKGPEKIFGEIINLAKKENAGWIRFDAENENILNQIKSGGYKIEKAPHDMQPKEIFMIDISKSEEEILSEMKEKTRYNIRLAEKKGIKIIVSQDKKYLDEFLRLVKITSERNAITSHPESYYRKMFEVIPEKNLKLYSAEFEGKIIAANLVAFYEKKATYLHGGSDNEYRNVMATFLLHWRAIQDAKVLGCCFYDFGGVRTDGKNNNWSGMSRFKIGFSKIAKPEVFPGSYDISLNNWRYRLYRIIQKIKSLF